MLYIIKTQSPDNDSYFLADKILPLFPKNEYTRKSYYCEDPKQFEEFLNDVDSLMLFAADRKVYLLYNLKITEAQKKLLAAKDKDIILINPNTKTFPGAKIYDKALSLPEIKRLIQEKLTEAHINVSVDAIVTKIAVTDAGGNIQHSPLEVLSIMKHLRLLKNDPKAIENYLKNDSPAVNHWQMVDVLLGPAAKRDAYFSTIMEAMDIYEIMTYIKSSLLLLTLLRKCLDEHIDAPSIAKTLGKHPFYIENLIKTIRSKNLSADQLLKLTQRFFNLETKIKSGEIIDADLAFSVVLATI